MNLRPETVVVCAVWKVILTHSEDKIPKFIYPHRVPYFEVHVWSLVREVSDENVRILDEPDYFVLQ